MPLALVFFVAISLLLHHARAADTTIQKELREFLGNLYVKAEKAASIADFIPLVAFPSDFPNDYPEVGAKVIAQQFGKQLLEWARDTQSKQKTHLYKVETLRTVEAHGLVLQVALVLGDGEGDAQDPQNGHLLAQECSQQMEVLRTRNFEVIERRRDS